MRYYSLVFLIVAIVAFVRLSAGRLAPRAALAPLVFLISRWPVLLGWGLGAAGMVCLVLPGALARGHDSVADMAKLVGICLFSGLGFAVLFVGPVFFIVRAFAPKPLFALEDGERALQTLSANHFLRGEARGGKLHVTDRRLAFVPHRFNVQLATWSVPFEQIRAFESEVLRLLLVHTQHGVEWLVVMDNKGLAQELSTHLRTHAAARGS